MRTVSRRKIQKRRRKIWLAVIILEACIFFGELGFFIWDITNDKSEAEGTVISSNKDGVDISGLAEEVNDKSGNNDKINTSLKAADGYDKFIFVGDSRYVGMEACVKKDDRDVFICRNNMGYSYLKNQLSNIKAIATKDSLVIIGLGVNDIGSGCSSYIKTINEMADTMECDICYMLVNPVEETACAYSGYSIKNESIDSFNKKMKQGLSDKVKIIDGNSYLRQSGFTAPDGLHYDSATYKKLYKYIKDSVNVN